MVIVARLCHWIWMATSYNVMSLNIDGDCCTIMSFNMDNNFAKYYILEYGLWLLQYYVLEYGWQHRIDKSLRDVDNGSMIGVLESCGCVMVVLIVRFMNQFWFGRSSYGYWFSIVSCSITQSCFVFSLWVTLWFLVLCFGLKSYFIWVGLG